MLHLMTVQVLGVYWSLDTVPARACLGWKLFKTLCKKHLNKVSEDLFSWLDHAAAYCYLTPCARFNIQTGQTYFRLERSCEKPPVSLLVIVSTAYFVSLLKWAPMSCLQNSHGVFSLQKRPVGLRVGCFTFQQACRGVRKRREGRGSEGLPLYQKNEGESNSCGYFFAHRLTSW